jgi:hypothetical protein
MISKEKYEKIYQLLDKVSPIKGDCGRLCQAACCQAEPSYQEGIQNADYEEGGELGMYLLPGEEVMLKGEDAWIRLKKESKEEYEFPPSWPKEVIFAGCKGPAACKRKKRPIQCRSFPLYPHLDKEKGLCLIYCDFELPYLCPLIEEQSRLNEDFILATYEAWKMLLEDKAVYDLIEMDSQAREEAAMGYVIVYPSGEEKNEN